MRIHKRGMHQSIVMLALGKMRRNVDKMKRTATSRTKKIAYPSWKDRAVMIC